MVNYCIFLILWSILVLLSVAWFLATKLGKASQHAPPQPPIASAQLTAPPPAGHVLSYAPPPVKQSSLLKHPWLSGIGALLQALLLLSIPSFLPILAWSTWGMLRPLGITALIVSTLTLLSACVIAGRGLHKTGDIPAAASWPRRRLLTLSLCGIPILILTLVILDLGTKHRMQQVRNAMDAQSQSLYIPVPIGTSNAANLYQQAFPSPDSVPIWMPRYPSSDIPAAPPALSPELEKAVPILHEAAQLPVVDWGIAPASYTVTTPLPHLSQLRQSANLLCIHAAREAQAGRTNSAIRDIHAQRAIARHAGQGYTPVEGLNAIHNDHQSYESTEDVLPLISDEQFLDQLIVQPDDWYQKLRIRMFREEQACCLRFMIDTYDGKVTPQFVGGSRITPTPLMRWTRVFLADADISGSRGLYNKMIAIAEKDPTQALPQIRQFDAQFWVRRHEAGPLTSITLSPATRTTEKIIEAEFMHHLNNTAIAARRYHLRTGHLPATLNDLISAKLLNQIPTDPFSGQPILLKAQQDQIIIYSVGPDGRDNGGDYITNKDLTFRLGTKPLWEIDAEAAKADQAAAEKEQSP